MIEKFWEIIEHAKHDAAGNWKEMYKPLLNRLMKLDIADLMIWYQIFLKYQTLSYKNKLWAAAYVINGGCSDDGFDYFRCWLTAQGKDVFLQALKNPDSLANLSSCEYEARFEEMLSVACDAYFKKLNIKKPDYGQFYDKLGNYPLPEDMKIKMESEIVYADNIDVVWNEDGLKELLPKLCGVFDW